MPLSLTPVLTHSEIEHIHERSLDLLERVGIDYQTPRALEVLERHGCPVDYERNWASLPRGLRRVGNRTGAARRSPGSARPVAERRSRWTARASHLRQPGFARHRLRNGRVSSLEGGISSPRHSVRRCARQTRHRQRDGGRHRRSRARAGATSLSNCLRADGKARAHGSAARRTGALSRGTRTRGDG